MKKIVVIFLAAALFLGIGIYYYQAKLARLTVESIIPAEPIFYLRFCDIEKRLNKFKATKLWRNITNIDVENLMKKSGAPQDQIKQYRRFNTDFSKFASNLLLNEFFGQEVALAVYPVAGGVKISGPGAISDIASNVILVTRVKPETKFLEFINKIYGKVDKQVAIKSEQYQKHEVNIIEINDNFSINYVKIKDLLVICLDKKGIYGCLDVLSKLKAPLCQDKDYLSTMAGLPKPAETLAYADLGVFFSGLKNLTDASLKNNEKNFQDNADTLKNFEKLEGFKKLGFVAVAGKVSKSKLIVTLDKSKFDSLALKNLSVKPQLNNTINFVPKDTIGYYWTCFDPQISWESLKEGISRQNAKNSASTSVDEAFKGMRDTLGVDLEADFIPALGNEAGALLSDINLSGPFPIPEFVVFIRVNNRGIIEHTLNNLIAKGNLQTRSEDYQNKSISYILLPFGMNLQPSYCFLDNCLLISTSSKLIQKCIDASKDKTKSLLANTDFEAINLGLTAKNNAMFFLRADSLFDSTKGICEWIIGWVSVMSKNAQAQQRQMEEALNSARKKVQDNELEYQNLTAEQQALKEEIDNLKKQGAATADEELELTRMNVEIKVKEEKLSLAKEELEKNEEEFNKASEYLAKRKVDPSLLKLYLDDVVYPILDGLKSIKAVGATTILKENTIEMLSYSNALE